MKKKMDFFRQINFIIYSLCYKNKKMKNINWNVQIYNLLFLFIFRLPLVFFVCIFVCVIFWTEKGLACYQSPKCKHFLIFLTTASYEKQAIYTIFITIHPFSYRLPCIGTIISFFREG